MVEGLKQGKALDYCGLGFSVTCFNQGRALLPHFRVFSRPVRDGLAPGRTWLDLQ